MRADSVSEKGGFVPRAADFSYPAAVYNRGAAERVVPRLIELFAPKSVVDVGCGLGTWLAAFRDRGVDRLLGIDQSLPGEFLLEPAHFLAADLTRDLHCNATFDLALSLEVAEHLPPEAADRFVNSLCQLAPTVVFSAAIPGQGGDGHCNEQWPAYWWNKFAEHGYSGSDALRWEFWEDSAIYCWYRQNLMVFSCDATACEKCATGNRGPVPVVHPEFWRGRVEWAAQPLWRRAFQKARTLAQRSSFPTIR
jgi:SAM-dependent methyltransferase